MFIYFLIGPHDVENYNMYSEICLISNARFSNQVVLELQEDGKLTTSDDPQVEFGCLDRNFIEQVCLKEVFI